MIIKLKRFNFILIIILIVLVISFPKLAAEGAINGLKLSAGVIIPSVFPFTVLALMLIKSGGFEFLSKIIGVKCSAWLLSSIGGYPSGAIILRDIYNKNTKDFCKRAINFSINAGPSFILSVVGINFIGNKNIGIILLASHLLSSFLICILTKGIKKNEIFTSFKKLPFFKAFITSIDSAISSMLGITGTVAFISSIYTIINNIFNNSFINKISSLFEVTIGIKENSNAIYYCAFLLGFSGISVIMQIKFITKDFNFNDLKFLFFRILHGALSIIFMKIITFFVPLSIETISNNIAFTNRIYYVSMPASIVFIFMCIVFVFSTLNKKINREKIHGFNKIKTQL